MNVDSQYSGPLNKTHLDFLHCVYKAASELNRTTKNISLRYIANSLLLSRGEILVISKYLSTEDFIKKDNPLDEIDCHVSITSKGIAELNKQVPQNLSDSTERLLRSNINVENVDIAVTKQEIESLQEVLFCIYKATEANTDKHIRLDYITKDIGLSENQVISIANNLVNQGFLDCRFELNSITDAVCITFEGIAKVENITDCTNKPKNNKPQNQVAQTLTVSPHPPFINEGRLQELRNFSSKQSKFDYSKLIRLCEELNSNYSNENYYATAMLTRAIMDHVPPIFGKNNFTEVANNYSGGDSFKKLMKNLNDFQKNISDGILHEQIRGRESLPNATQVNCSQALDKLLEEIVRILKP
jgi:DNA-binding MarR family transcriptional regulator